MYAAAANMGHWFFCPGDVLLTFTVQTCERYPDTEDAASKCLLLGLLNMFAD